MSAVHPAAGAVGRPAPFGITAMNGIAVASIAALCEQVFHEATHGVAAILVGARWVAFNLLVWTSDGRERR